MFEADTGIEVGVTKPNNEEMIAKLRATSGGGFDLAQPGQDRISGAQIEFDIYKPIDISKIDTSLCIGSMLEATKSNTPVDGAVYGVPDVRRSIGLAVVTATAGGVKDYLDLCGSNLAGKVWYRLKRPTLIGFVFAMGMDPFVAYGDEAAYIDIINKVESKLVECKSGVKTCWGGGDELMGLMRSGEVVASRAWVTGGWKMNAHNPNITFLAAASGALGWIDTFALPRKTKAEDAAYKWINFVMQLKIAAMITAEAG